MSAQGYDTRKVKCPICNKGKLFDVSMNIVPSNIRTHPPDSNNDGVECFVKCPKCKSQVGVSIIRQM
jgi:phage FluMu protein Com